MFDIEITGLDDAMKNLKILPTRIQKNILVGALRASAKPIIKEAKALVPKDTGQLKKSIGIIKHKSKDRNIIHFSVSPRRGIKNSGWYAHMVEFGTTHSAVRPFMRPAFERKGDETLDAAKKYIAKRFDEEVKKIAKK